MQYLINSNLIEYNQFFLKFSNKLFTKALTFDRTTKKQPSRIDVENSTSERSKYLKSQVETTQAGYVRFDEKWKKDGTAGVRVECVRMVRRNTRTHLVTSASHALGSRFVAGWLATVRERRAFKV